MDNVKYDLENKPGISNLLTIASSLSKKSIEEIENDYSRGTQKKDA